MRKIACILALIACLGTTACSASSIRSATHARRQTLWQAGWCSLHGWRMVRDYEHHHIGWGALQTGLTAYHCTKLLRSLHH